jgi:nucleoside-diphosphate-sugar epimerase
MKTVALLGGSRFVGYHLLLTLIRKGHAVTLFNRGFTRPPVPFPNNIKIVNGDRNNPKDIDRLFNHDFDVVFDLSGYNPDHMKPIINNYQSQIGHYIYCSSASVYENLMDPQLKEESPCTLIENTYGRNKALAENLLMDQYKETQWPVTILRPYAVFGPYDNNGSTNRQLGFIFHRVTHSIPIPVKSRNKGRLNLLYVDDLVNGLIRCMENSISHGKIYNIASDEHTSVQEIIELSGKVCTIKPKVHWVDNHAYDDIPMECPWFEHDWILDNTKIKKELSLEFIALEIALSTTHTWFRNTPHYPNITYIRGEQYLLGNRAIPKIVRIYWKFADGIHPFFMSLYQKMGGRKNRLLYWAIKNIRNLF